MSVLENVEDLLGNPVAVGDEITGAFRIGNIAVQRVGTVLSFGERSGKPTVKVQWHHESSPYGAGTRPTDTVGAIEADLKRFVKVSSGATGVLSETTGESLDSTVTP